MVGGLVSFALVFALMGRDTASTSRVVLTGVVVGQLFSAVTSLVVTAWGDADATRGITYWLLGSLAAARWSSVVVCTVVVVLATVVFVAVAPALDAFVFGHDAAVALGIDVRVLRIVVLVGAAATTAAVVAAVGAIGFVGLVVPHAARMLVGPGHRLLLPVSALAGAVFLVVADLAGRLALAPHQIPVGVVTALIGVPTFLVVLRRGQRA
ncbi:iron ABC transporter permease [Curtobacterium sp. MCJR17_043]|uniref:FecCD family ABC transporter permease n=1 Tax=Curtobacterium sp. MCJR17_043 TaxID=2175660 RepID=UPI0024DF9D84|nr:iron ABC transporter permease [Curtobacterium sp. MCJR17_043]WIB34825.1 iron ABC transporter permease [Curtobacterium sp. MCJR17_043]